MNTLIKIFLLFLTLTIASAVMIQDFGIQFGTVNYWKNHGILLLLFLTLFPRLTLVISSIVSGGLLWWLAWLITPRFLVAYLATMAYWKTNPILVVITWLVALGGESSEKTVFINRGSPFRHKETVIIDQSEHPSSQANFDGQAINAEFEVKKESDLE